MKVTKLHGDKLYYTNISKSLINWSKIISAPQKFTKDFLFPFWRNHIVCEEWVIPCSGGLRFDLVNWTRKIIIEVSPNSTHTEFNQFFHKSRGGFLKRIRKDFQKMEYAEKNHFKFVELYDEDLENLSKNYFKEKFDVEL